MTLTQESRSTPKNFIPLGMTLTDSKISDGPSRTVISSSATTQGQFLVHRESPLNIIIMISIPTDPLLLLVFLKFHRPIINSAKFRVKASSLPAKYVELIK